MFAEQHANAIRDIYGTLADADGGSRALDILRNHIGAEHVVMARIRYDATETLQVCSQLRDTDIGQFDALWTDGPIRPLTGIFGDGRAVRMTTLVPAETLMRSEIYARLISTIDGGLSAIYVQQDGDGCMLTAICRSAIRQRDFADSDLISIGHIMPHVLSANAIVESMQRAQRSAQGIYAVLDAISDGVVMLDENRRVIHANGNALALAQRGGFYLSNTGLHAELGAEDAGLQLAIRAAMALDRRNADPEAILSSPKRLTISRPQRQLPLSVRVVPGRGFDSAAVDNIAAAIVVISAPGETDIASTDELIAQFGLTPREAELAVMLSRSTDLVAAAALLDITIGTARQYLKSLFAKTDTHSQARLLQVLRK